MVFVIFMWCRLVVSDLSLGIFILFVYIMFGYKIIIILG